MTGIIEQQQRRPREGDRSDARADDRSVERSTLEGQGRHVELWVRGQSPCCVHDAPEETYDRLRRLRGSGAIDSFAIHQWSDAGRTPRTRGVKHTATCHGKVAEFEDWATERGYTLQPGFQVREVKPMIGDSVRRKLVSPVQCLAIYDDDALAAVFPHADGEDSYTVADGLRQLETDADTSPERRERA